MKNKPAVKLIVLFVLAVTILPVAAFSQASAKKEALAEQLLTLFNIDKSFDVVFQRMAGMQEKMLDSQNLSPEQKEKRIKDIQLGIEEAKKALDWNSIKPMFVKIYSDTFDEADLQGMLDFFKSPVGQKWIEKQPQIQMATMQKMQEFMPKIQAAIMKAQAKAAQGGAAAATP